MEKIEKKSPRIVIVGGGAAGLELATRLGDSLGKRKEAKIILIDKNLTHIWKPLWHEVAAGTLNSSEDEINYIVHSYYHFFEFQFGKFIRIDRKTKKIFLEAIYNTEGEEILPERMIDYDILIFAIGSLSYDFNIPGVKENCFFIDSVIDCEIFHQKFLENLIRLQEKMQTTLNMVIIGGGATGVELAGELKFASEQALHYKNVHTNVHINIVESAPRILPNLPPTISHRAQKELKRMGIKVFINEKVSKVDKKHVYTQKNLSFDTDLTVWAAGIKAPPILSKLGLKTNGQNQLPVQQTLQLIDDENIFALGDCACCPQKNSEIPVPPRAQAAHQQAKLLAKSLARYLRGKPLLPFLYHDYGSLITLSQSRALANFSAGNILLIGTIPHLTYRLLYRQHQATLYGWWRIVLLMLAQLLAQPVRPRLKLH